MKHAWTVPVLVTLVLPPMLCAQTPETPQDRLKRLSTAIAQTQSQMKAYEQQLQELQKQVDALQKELGNHPSEEVAGPSQVVRPAPADTTEEIQERQAIAESQIATHEQTKVETESKYPLRLTGLILLNGFINTHRVDDAIAPTYALNGDGSTGLSVRQTILGFDATGPHLLGAESHADLRVDFFANGSQQTYGASGILRLRTAHASLVWEKTEAFFAQDRSLLAPNVPTSLVSTAQPNLSWSGDLWTWNPQIGVRQRIPLKSSQRLEVAAALLDVQDPLLPNATSSSTVTRAERSRWPGLEGRIGYASGQQDEGPAVGVGGYFGPHRTSEGYRFNAWAISGDLRLPMGRYVQLTSNVYRGAGLGGLGGGGYVDYFYPAGKDDVAQALNDAGGWIQFKFRPVERLQFNAGYGIDNPFAADIRSSLAGTPSYTGLSKNRDAFGNVIVSPSKYLEFSLEYRRLWSNYVNNVLRLSDAIGLAAGYRF
ncbi:hypothetical protein [Terriglobus sp. TAA 43]|uniref:hypothetical protein n=1 Tax=Terriglobus sp. TAA 43 TaxID=278961 RepID=UPI001E5DC38A|nr:hypothetical protein [Terriglobus sp. TAA 43]